MSNYLPPDMEQHNAMMRRLTKIAAGCALVALFFWIIGAVSADGGRVYLPITLGNRKPEPTVTPCNPCAHSTPYLPTATPFVGEPPMPTVEVQP